MMDSHAHSTLGGHWGNEEWVQRGIQFRRWERIASAAECCQR
jgi:hypothetical protein